jgi:1-deoxy-D-xylulose-5-phosphate reductoisomerase
MRSLLVLGCTGSIGVQTLDVVRASGGRFRVTGLAARTSWRELAKQALEFQPRYVALEDPGAAEDLRALLPASIELLAGPDALEQLCERAEFDLAVHGVVGARGVRASERVLARGKLLALANKESLVVAGAQLMELARVRGGAILPVDSELCAIHQCLAGAPLSSVRRIVLTASGGPFRDLEPERLDGVTPAMALKHPTWSMGPRITIGSATLMNKALEVVEAHHLFGLERARIEVVIHRQSIVHSLVEFVDGSVLAQLGPPDMRGPLHYCLHHPERAPSKLRGFDLELFRQLSFEPVDPRRFPALELGFECVEQGGDSGAVLNAADEVTVQAFLEGQIAFPQITRINREVLARRPRLEGSIERLLEADQRSRELARRAIAEAPVAAARPPR